MFIPTTPEEVHERGWDSLDVILISGDTYVDTSTNGAAIIGHWLIDNGFRVGIICQPDVKDTKDVGRLGIPNLYWGVTAGSLDSMVANYTSTRKLRNDQDDLTPGGINNRRPDRACIVYSNLIRRLCKDRPIVLGGVEATLRRITHYDYWSDSLRRSILFDAKADIITYGMGERSNLALAESLRDGKDWHGIRGICYISKEIPEGYLELPDHDACCGSKATFTEAFNTFYMNNDPMTAKGLAQKQDTRYLIQNPPSAHLTTEELDRVYELDYENEVHPYYLALGEVRGIVTVRESVTTHRGCYGECNFCAIALVQGRTVVSRSEESILREVGRITSKPGFKGHVRNLGGPTGNMYGFECRKKQCAGPCTDKRCLYPTVCKNLNVDHSAYLHLLQKVSAAPGVKMVSVASGIRYDLICGDKKHGQHFLRELCEHHVSGQMRVAPEHVSDDVLRLMGKPGKEVLLDFKKDFNRINRELGKEQYLSYYLMAAHPGCGESHMAELARFCKHELRLCPEQVQIFSPTPSTISALMYYTGKDWETGEPVFVERSIDGKQRQKDIVVRPKSAESDTKKAPQTELR